MKEIALALGGGGSRGIAHVGIIRALQKEGFSIKAIAGSSAGGIVGAAFANGVSIEVLTDIALKISDLKIFSHIQLSDPSILGLAGLEKELLKTIGDIEFSDLQIPFGCTAVEIENAQEYIFTSGKVIDAVMATIAVPGIFPPKVIGDFAFVDGSILDPVPVALARWLAPHLPIIAVCLTPAPAGWAHMPPLINPPANPFTKPILDQFSKLRISRAFNIFSRSMETTARMLAELKMQIDHPDIILRPKVDQIGLLDAVSVDDLIQKGEDAVTSSLKEINQIFGVTKQVIRLFNQPTQPGRSFDQKE
ncbi:MAG: patatin-like phospholipase family protein [Anaerolineaceae bacterium]|nr:patatin-like phospholipase family protein [Anaerolineaceae bacterium]